MKKIKKLTKAIIMLGVGFIIPIHALVEPDGTKYKCTFKGVRALDTGNIEDWSDIMSGLSEYINN
jgi:hypothetical protein